MDRRMLALKDRIKKHSPQRENLNPATWVRPETVKGFTDFLLQKHSDNDTDNSFDNKEMLLDTEKKFIEAAMRNDIEAMKVLGRGVNASARNVHNRTALHYAVAGKHVGAVEFLLRRRVKVDQKDKHGVTPMHLAAWFGSLEIMQLLVKAGAEQKTENNEGFNILHCAAINNHTDIIEYIVDDLHMKELNIQDNSGQKAFALAAEYGCVAMLDLLMGPSYKMANMKPNKNGDTPLHLAAKNGHLDAVDLLLLNFDTRDEVTMAGETALYQAALNAHEEVVLSLLANGCNPNILTAKCSVLHPVTERGDTSLLKVLIDHQAQMDFQDEHLETPLHVAVKKCHIPVIHTLLEAGCNVNVTNKRGQTAMHLAAELARVDVVEMLLKAGQDLTLRDQQGKTALGVAARADEVIIVDMIIKAERFYAWKQANAELNESLRSQSPLTFKLDHRSETKQFRSMAWRLAYQLLKRRDWKRLAVYWGFTPEQVAAIEEQWTGKDSYREHGNRMLLIWFHGMELGQNSPAKDLYQALIFTGNRKAADTIRMESEGGVKKSCSIA